MSTSWWRPAGRAYDRGMGLPRSAGGGAVRPGLGQDAHGARTDDRRPRARVGQPGRGAGVRLHRADVEVLCHRGGAARDRGLHQPAARGTSSPPRRRHDRGAHACLPTSVEALEGELVDVGDGRPADYARANAAGKNALGNGLPAPGRAWAAQQAGTLGQIFVLMDHLHNMIVTTIWGTPSPETAWRIPAGPRLPVLGAGGQRLRADLARCPATGRP